MQEVIGSTPIFSTNRMQHYQKRLHMIFDILDNTKDSSESQQHHKRDEATKRETEERAK